MSQRNIPLITEEIYHLFNRSVARQPILTKIKDFQRFLETVDFYRFQNPHLRYSHYQRLPVEQKVRFLDNLYKTGDRIVDIYAFSLMPNHFHILAKQIADEGIKLFVSRLQNSYAKYYNTKYERSGSLFQEMFKAVRIETDEQFIHVARYIHINPLTSYVVKNLKELELYAWTSFVDYVGKRELSLLDKDMLMSHFPNKHKLKQFTFDQVDYQRKLQQIKHLALE